MNSKIEEKLKHLLKLAANAATDGEAAAAAAQAAKIAEKYRIDIATLGEVEEQTIQSKEPLYESQNRSAWKDKLANVLAKYNGCQVLVIPGDRYTRRKSKTVIIGKVSDIQVVRYLFAYLSLELARLSKINCKGKGKSFSNSYLFGAVSGVGEQLQKAQNEVREQATSTAIAIVNKRLQDAEDEMNRLHPKTKLLPASLIYRDPYNLGKQDGKNIHLGKSLNNGKILPS